MAVRSKWRTECLTLLARCFCMWEKGSLKSGEMGFWILTCCSRLRGGVMHVWSCERQKCVVHGCVKEHGHALFCFCSHALAVGIPVAFNECVLWSKHRARVWVTPQPFWQNLNILLQWLSESRLNSANKHHRVFLKCTKYQIKYYIFLDESGD